MVCGARRLRPQRYMARGALFPHSRAYGARRPRAQWYTVHCIPLNSGYANASRVEADKI